MKIRGLTLSAFLLLILINCSSKDANQEADIRLHDIWVLESFDGAEYNGENTGRSRPIIEIYIKEKRVHGNTGCNTLNGKLEINDVNISFSEMITTEMACPGDFEKTYLSALESVTNYKIEKLKLLLFEGDKIRMIFRKID